MDYRDYYATLGVDKGASQGEIRKAFRRLAREHHPDVNKDKAAEQRFKEISEANEVLSDPEKRKAYDQLGADWASYQRAAAGGDPFAGGYPARRALRVPWRPPRRLRLQRLLPHLLRGRRDERPSHQRRDLHHVHDRG